jgi:hypothetical protein
MFPDGDIMKLVVHLRRRLRLLHGSGDEGLMSLVMVVIIIGMGLAAVMTPLVVAQSTSTAHTDYRVQALHGAESGLNTMIGRLRSATSSGGSTGVASSLPCFPAGSPLSATQPGASSTTYQVTLSYSASDPLQPSSTPLSCSDVTNGVIPGFARITAVGQAGVGTRSATRTLAATYSFASQDIYNATATPTAVAGGQIRFKPRVAATQPLCIDAGQAAGAGTYLNLTACGALTTSSQQFNYTSDLTLRLAGSISTAAPYGLCIDSESPDTSVTLQPCVLAGQATYDQQWSWTDNTTFSQVRPSGGSFCLTVATGATTVTAKACPSGYDDSTSWLPTPYAGTGAAGAGMNQLVNLSQFGRCADVTNATVPSSSPAPFLILYPCVQATSPANVDWFQKFSFDPGTGHWSTTRTGDQVSYCLTSAGIAGGKVTVTACSSAASQKWTDNGAAAVDQTNASQYSAATRFTIVDSSNRCLSLTATSGPNPEWFTVSNVQYSKLTTDTCDASARQKWNAPSPASAVKDITEN